MEHTIGKILGNMTVELFRILVANMTGRRLNVERIMFLFRLVYDYMDKISFILASFIKVIFIGLYKLYRLVEKCAKPHILRDVRLG